MLHQKLGVFSVLASAGDNKSLVNQVLDTWNRLVTLAYGSELMITKPLVESEMKDEYEKIKNLRPEFKISRQPGASGDQYSIVLTGLKL